MAETITLEELLTTRLLDVPDYQRGYAWGEQQLREFWEDLELTEPGGRHYTGTVVLKDRKTLLKDEVRRIPLSAFDVVDGQQRITTCVMLLDRLYDHLEALGDEDTPSDRRRLLTARVDGVDRPKLQLGPDLRDFWNAVILNDKPWVDGAPLASQQRLIDASRFFDRKIAERKNGAAGDHHQWLRDVAGKVVGSLAFTLYTAEEDAEVGVIFETLNQRGRPLTELEKTKNYLLYLATRLPDGQRQILADTINGSWKTIYTNLGRLSTIEEDQLLRAHWLATQNPRQQEWARVNSVKERFHRRRYVDAKDALFDEVTNYATSLREASFSYRDIVRGDGADAFKAYDDVRAHVVRASRNLRHAGVVQIFAPLLIAARLRFPDAGEPYLALVEQCERYSVRVFLIMERRANAGQAKLYSLAYDLYRGGDVDAALAGLAERIAYFASDAEIELDLKSVRRNWYAKRGHKYFLYQYEIHRLGGKPPQLPFDHFIEGEFKSTSTEHILPQSPTDPCWTSVFTDEQRSYMTHALGNLVLTYDNSVYSNFCFERKSLGPSRDGKVDGCYATSPLKQEQDLAQLDAWTPAAVVARQEQLALWALARWSVPNAPTPNTVFLSDDDDDAEPPGDPGGDEVVA